VTTARNSHRRPAPSGRAASAVSGPASRDQPLLEVTGLCVDYGFGQDAIHAVVEADLVLRRGEVLGLAGESGSGKSTLAYAITRLLRAPGVITGGQVLFHTPGTGDQDLPASAAAPWHTIDLLDAGPEQLRALRWNRIAVVLQSAMHALNPVLSVGAQLTDVLRAHRPEMDRAARLTRAGQLLELVGIPADRLGNYPHELSGGMRQRVMIAMALALEPQIVIMDEPTTALDVVTQREILEELMDLRDRLGFAILFITHDLSLLIEIGHDRRDVCGPDRRDSRSQAALPSPAASILARPAEILPGAARAAPADDRYRGLAAGHAPTARRMRVSSALPLCDGQVPRGHPTAAPPACHRARRGVLAAGDGHDAAA